MIAMTNSNYVQLNHVTVNPYLCLHRYLNSAFYFRNGFSFTVVFKFLNTDNIVYDNLNQTNNLLIK